MSGKEDNKDEDTPQTACVQCRTKKHKCSRGNPCKSCEASGALCYYVERRKRGAKPGHYDAIAKRIDQLESIVLGQSLLFSLKNPELQLGAWPPPSLDKVSDSIKDALTSISESTPESVASATSASYKKRRIESPNAHKASVSSVLNGGDIEVDTLLPPDDLLTELVDHYFRQIHPWIPILHENSFKPIILGPDRPIVILQAITAVTVKFTTNLPVEQQDVYYRRCRQAAVLASMDRFSVETLQASIIIAYDTLGSGRGPRSWSIISSATRIVEQLGLAEEEEDLSNDKLLNRVGFLSPSKTIAEREARRRIFWSIFQMDRFCSVVTGWNTSLTSTDVRRRLPIEGNLWRDNITKKTRFFNISDNEIDPTDENDALGGYAYSIEAAECLSRVASFLMKERVDFTTSEGLKTWFDRFQALDTMLVRWKTFLPAKWQVASVPIRGKLDENLTLAHVMHNTSVLLLHQNIAYPPLELNIGLPSRQSAQTCLMAATEITTIMSKFLTHVEREVSPQFSFLIFVAARTFLTHSLRNNSELSANFETLVGCLREMSRRWVAHGSRRDNLALKFAERLDKAKSMNSPIDARAAVFDEEEERGGNELSLSSPPIVDLFRQADPANMNRQPYPDHVKYELLQGIGFDVSQAGLSDIDHIFTWKDYSESMGLS